MNPAPSQPESQTAVQRPGAAGGSAGMDAAGGGYRPWLHRFAWALVATTFVLVVAGGTVTSRGVGLAVPDWPNSFGYNMFLFPPSMWRGGIFWEHVHRLLGSLVGMLCIAMTGWLWITQKDRPWLRKTGIALLLTVIVQGIMGGLRVTQISVPWAVVHGITAQLFFCLTLFIVAATSRWWLRESAMAEAGRRAAGTPVPHDEAVLREQGHSARVARRWTLALLGAILVQLVLGAAMRHTGSGLAIPDFPTSYGRWMPPMNAEAIDAVMAEIPYDEAPPVTPTPGQIHVHFAHRLWAMVVLGVALGMAGTLWRRSGGWTGSAAAGAVRRLGITVMALLGIQIALGIAVVLTGHPPEPHPEVATAHQVTGALLLGTVFMLTLHLTRAGGGRTEAAPASSRDRSPLGHASFAVEGSLL